MLDSVHQVSEILQINRNQRLKVDEKLEDELKMVEDAYADAERNRNEFTN
jgi:hypothetical protein